MGSLDLTVIFENQFPCSLDW